MAYFKTNDHERELLEESFLRRGLAGEALEKAIALAKAQIDAGKPLAYLTGEQAFYDLVFSVNEEVLVPRPDTERLVEKALSLLPRGGSFVDLGTGSGCVALTVLHHRPDLTAVAIDLSPGALQVAKANAERIGVIDRVRFLCADMLKNPLGDGMYDLVLSNPPYIPTADMAHYPSLAYEPLLALDGGADGLDFYRAILGAYRTNLKKTGGFLFEIGYDQRKGITALAEACGLNCEITKDYGGNDRVAYLPLPGGAAGKERGTV